MVDPCCELELGRLKGKNTRTGIMGGVVREQKRSEASRSSQSPEMRYPKANVHMVIEVVHVLFLQTLCAPCDIV
jgi:hypothetical protein